MPFLSLSGLIVFHLHVPLWLPTSSFPFSPPPVHSRTFLPFFYFFYSSFYLSDSIISDQTQFKIPLSVNCPLSINLLLWFPPPLNHSAFINVSLLYLYQLVSPCVTCIQLFLYQFHIYRYIYIGLPLSLAHFLTQSIGQYRLRHNPFYQWGPRAILAGRKLKQLFLYSLLLFLRWLNMISFLGRFYDDLIFLYLLAFNPCWEFFVVDLKVLLGRLSWLSFTSPRV